MKKRLVILLACAMLAVFPATTAFAQGGDDFETDFADLFAVGDVDCNGVVNTTDRALLRKTILGLYVPKNESKADVNGSKTVDVCDLVMLNRQLSA